VLNQNVIKPVRCFLEFIKTLINVHDLTKDGGRRSDGRGVGPGVNMLTKLPGDRRDFLGSHFFNKFPFAIRSLEEVDVFEGGRSEDRHGLGV